MRLRSSRGVVVLACALACAGREEAAAPEPQPTHALLVRQDGEPPGVNCAAGGVAVRAGLDGDDDGVLDDGEVAKTSYACGAVAAPVVTALVDEPAGPNCPDGGTRVDAGADLDGDGVLQAAEVTRTAFVCAAAPPPAPADPPAPPPPPPPPPPPVLAIVIREPPGQHCPFGGSAVLSGADADGDGALTGPEVANTDYVCEVAALSGFVVSSPEDWLLLRQAAVVKGDVIVESPTLEAVDLYADRILGSVVVRNNAKLQRVTLTRSSLPDSDVTLAGSLVVTDNPALLSVLITPGVPTSLTSSRVTGDVLVARNPALVWGGSGFDSLVQVDGSVAFEGNAGMVGIRLDRMARVGGDLRITRNPALGTSGGTVRIATQSIGGTLHVEGHVPYMIELPFLLTAGAVRAWAIDVPTGIWTPSLRYVSGSVTIADNAAAVRLYADDLLAVDGDLVVAGNAANVDTGQLARLEWIGGDLVFASNPVLADPGLYALRAAARLYVSGNAALASLQGTRGGSLARLESLAELGVHANPALAHLRLPALARLWTLNVSQSPLVPTCEVTALVAQLSAPPQQAFVSGTDDAGQCP